MEIIHRRQPISTQHTIPKTRTTKHPDTTARVDWTTWWLWRGAPTRSHPELGRENPQRPWYCVLRHGRVGRRQVFQSTQTKPSDKPRDKILTPAGWSSPVARQAHNLKVTGSNPVPATNNEMPGCENDRDSPWVSKPKSSRHHNTVDRTAIAAGAGQAKPAPRDWCCLQPRGATGFNENPSSDCLSRSAASVGDQGSAAVEEQCLAYDRRHGLITEWLRN